MDAIYHARSSAMKWGGDAQEYLAIHEWFDESSMHVDDYRHRAHRHHSLGIQEAIQHFGRMLTLSTGKQVPVKHIAERHINEDLGFVPTLSDWIREIKPTPWMRARKIIRTIL